MTGMALEFLASVLMVKDSRSLRRLAGHARQLRQESWCTMHFIKGKCMIKHTVAGR